MARQTVQERFWSKVQIGTSDVCWNWLASVDGSGHGRFGKLDGKTMRAHRVSALWAGIIPQLDTKTCVLHKCDNARCVNPAHLYPGTVKQNNIDTWTRNRRPKQNKSKHSEETKTQIVTLFTSGVNPSKISRQLGLKKSFVFCLLRRKGLR